MKGESRKWFENLVKKSGKTSADVLRAIIEAYMEQTNTKSITDFYSIFRKFGTDLEGEAPVAEETPSASATKESQKPKITKSSSPNTATNKRGGKLSIDEFRERLRVKMALSLEAERERQRIKTRGEKERLLLKKKDRLHKRTISSRRPKVDWSNSERYDTFEEEYS